MFTTLCRILKIIVLKFQTNYVYVPFCLFHGFLSNYAGSIFFYPQLRRFDNFQTLVIFLLPHFIFIIPSFKKIVKMQFKNLQY